MIIASIVQVWPRKLVGENNRSCCKKLERGSIPDLHIESLHLQSHTFASEYKHLSDLHAMKRSIQYGGVIIVIRMINTKIKATAKSASFSGSFNRISHLNH